MRPDSIPYPREAGVHFSIRALSASELRAAELVETKRKLSLAAAAGSAIEALAAIEESRRVSRNGSAPVAAAPGDIPAEYESYNVEAVVKTGLDGWSGPGYDDVACTDGNKKQLDEPTETFIFVEIMKRSKLTQGEGTSSSVESMPASATAAASDSPGS